MTTVSFRALTDDDLPMLHAWLNEPAVVEWWEGDDVSWDAVVADYGSDSDPDMHHFVVLDGGEPVGWIQWYLAVDSPGECRPWFTLGVDRTAAGIDYLLGTNANRGRGVGSRMIAAFAAEVVFPADPAITQVCAGPFTANVASCRALEKAGFRFVGTIHDDDGPCSLMALDRPAG